MSNMVSVTIGRNVKNAPMNDTEWQNFQEDARAIIDANVRPYSDSATVAHEAVYLGTGAWDGIPEESANIVVVWDGQVSTTDLGAALGRLARVYGQDAVAMAVGHSTLHG